jgi:hypothetical protein
MKHTNLRKTIMIFFLPILYSLLLSCSEVAKTSASDLLPLLLLSSAINPTNPNQPGDPTSSFTITPVTTAAAVFTSGTLPNEGTIHTYSFTAAANSMYAIVWDDKYQGSSAYTADVKVSATDANGVTL